LNTYPYPYGNVTIDNVGNAWAGNLNPPGLELPIEVVIPVAPATQYHLYNPLTSFTYSYAAVADGSGDVFFPHGPSTHPITLTEFNSARTDISDADISSSFVSPYSVNHGAIDHAGYLWLTSEAGNIISRVAANGTVYSSSYPKTSTCSSGNIASPENIAIGQNDFAWIPQYAGGDANQLLVVVDGNCYYTGAQGQGSYGIALDGGSGVWVTNRKVSTITEFNSSNEAIVNFALTAGGLLKDPMNIAVDISGDLMITDFAGNSLIEIIGGATPTYAPLGLAAKNNKLAQEP
jgi:streptogramin lyase